MFLGDNTLLVIGCVILMVITTISISELIIQRRVTKYAPLKGIFFCLILIVIEKIV